MWVRRQGPGRPPPPAAPFCRDRDSGGRKNGRRQKHTAHGGHESEDLPSSIQDFQNLFAESTLCFLDSKAKITDDTFVQDPPGTASSTLLPNSTRTQCDLQLAYHPAHGQQPHGDPCGHHPRGHGLPALQQPPRRQSPISYGVQFYVIRTK